MRIQTHTDTHRHTQTHTQTHTDTHTHTHTTPPCQQAISRYHLKKRKELSGSTESQTRSVRVKAHWQQEL